MQPASIFGDKLEAKNIVLEIALLPFAALRSAGLFLRYRNKNNISNLLQFKVKCLLLIFTEICIAVAGNTVAALLAAYLCFPMKSTAIASLNKECQG